MGRSTRLAYERPDVVDHYEASACIHGSEQFLFSQYLKPGMDILDVGVGAGRTTPLLSALARRYVGIDYSEAMIERCRKRFPDRELLLMDASDLSAFPTANFDAVVFSFNGIGTLPTHDARRRCIAECHRVLRTPGVFIFSVHNARFLIMAPSLTQARGFKIIWRILYSQTQTLHNMPNRLLARAFWSGRGYVLDPLLHGGLTVYAATPRQMTAELTAGGFDLLRVVGARYPANMPSMTTQWYYYAARRRLA